MTDVAAVDLHTHPLIGRSLIEASAGTGKTYTISHIYLRTLLESDHGVSNILVVTFTNAATQELRGRIRKLIADACHYLAGGQPDKDLLISLIEPWRGNREAVKRLQLALAEFDEAAIYSIHGFCQKLLATFPLELNALLQHQIQADQASLYRQAIHDFWRLKLSNSDRDESRFFLELWRTPAQLLRAIGDLIGFESSGGLIEVAVDEVLQKRVTGLWWKLVEQWRLTGSELSDFLINSTFLNRSKIRKNTVRQLVEGLDELFSGTTPPVCLPDKWTLLTYTKLQQSQKAGQQDARIELEFFKTAQELSDIFQNWFNMQKRASMQSAFAFVSDHVNSARQEAMILSFDDLIGHVAEAIKTAGPSLIKSIRSRYPIAMVDEFQDTDSLQYHIFATLFADDSQGLILIGDPKQAIYGFRGADLFAYQKARMQTGSIFGLDTNFRSSCDYVEMLNRIFSHNPGAFVLEDFIQYRESLCGRNISITQDGKALPPLACWLYPFQQKPAAKQDAEPWFATQCAAEIRGILDDQSMLLDGEKVQPGDLAVLVRKSSQARLIKDALDRQGVNSALYSRESVYATQQAVDISMLLEVLLEPTRSDRLFGLLSTELFGFSLAAIERLQNDSERLIELIEGIQGYHELWREKGLLAMFFRLMEDFDTLSQNMCIKGGERRLTNWIHIVEDLQQQEHHHASLNQALHWLLKQREEADLHGGSEDNQLRLESDGKLVRIITIHKSKGLQYPVVFLPFMASSAAAGGSPATYLYHDQNGQRKLAILDNDHLDRLHQEERAEETRLFYVAMTRAKYRCYVGWGNINGAGGSGMARCLYPDKIVAGRYGESLELADQDELLAPLLMLNRGKNLLEILQESPPSFRSRDISAAREKNLSALEFRRKIRMQWRVSSYSQLASSSHDEENQGRDHDALTKSLSAADEGADKLKDRFHFPKGARAGSFLHEILEEIDFTRELDPDFIRNKCIDAGYDERWSACLLDWLSDILSCPLKGFSLADIAAHKKVVELEFYLSSEGLDAKKLNALLQQHGYSHNHFEFAELNGFLKGFIDLVFEYDGRYFIADYKSNYLGDLQQDYNEEAMSAAMFDHDYHLQYLIYTVALHRFLKSRLPDYEYERHVGGVLYLFLRGMSSSSSSNGVYFHRPSATIIQALDELLGATIP